MDTADIKALMETFDSSDMTLLEYEKDGVKLKFKKQSAAHVTVSDIMPAKYDEAEIKSGADIVALPNREAESGEYVRSPLVGTFYEAPSPDDEPFVKVGDTIKKGQVLGIVEAMKLMNEIEAEKDGVLKAILVKNGDVVEYDQPMFEIA